MACNQYYIVCFKNLWTNFSNCHRLIIIGQILFILISLESVWEALSNSIKSMTIIDLKWSKKWCQKFSTVLVFKIEASF